MLVVVDLNGSGAATLESFCVVSAWLAQLEKLHRNTFSHLVQTMAESDEQGDGHGVKEDLWLTRSCRPA